MATLELPYDYRALARQLTARRRILARGRPFCTFTEKTRSFFNKLLSPSSPGVSYNVLLSRLFDVELSAIFSGRHDLARREKDGFDQALFSRHIGKGFRHKTCFFCNLAICATRDLRLE